MKININLDDVDSNALEYILDLVEQDFIQAGGTNNNMRGSRLFQEINVLKNRLKQEITVARQEEYADSHSQKNVAFAAVKSEQEFHDLIQSWHDKK